MIQTLQYEDFVLRIMQIAAEHEALLEGAVISLPVPVSEQSQQENISPSLLAFLYTLRDEEDEFEGDEGKGDDNEEMENPEIFHPYARVQLRLNGEIVEWEMLPEQIEQSIVGQRFSGIAAEMEPDEIVTFIETYYELLTSDEGPLWRPWSNVESTIIHDLRELFNAMVEVPFLPLYRQHADEFLNLIETP